MSEKKPVIVAIDDEVEFTSIVHEYFELREYDISVANKGVDGLALIKEKKPDVLILDYKMPGVGGNEVLALAKEMQPGVKIIFVSAYYDGGNTKAKLLEAGAYDFIDKPLPSITILEETVMRAFKEASKGV